MFTQTKVRYDCRVEGYDKCEICGDEFYCYEGTKPICDKCRNNKRKELEETDHGDKIFNG